jgi:hypothetical protein
MFAFEIGPLQMLMCAPFAVVFVLWLVLKSNGPRR